MKNFVVCLSSVCLCLVSFLSLPLSADPIYLVKDIETEGLPFQVPTPFPLIIQAFGGLPFGLAAVDDRVAFLANDRVSGFEPWVSDGTEAGTMLLRDTCPGNCGAEYQFWISSPRSLIFYSGDSELERTYWTSDGTPAGTEPFVPLDTFLDFRNDIVFLNETPYGLADDALVRPKGGSQPAEIIESFCEGFPSHRCETALRQEGGVLYIAEWVSLAVSNRIVRIWSNDGTVGGTRLLAEAPASDLGGLRTLLLPDGKSLVAVSFRPTVGQTAETLMLRTDGTLAGTEVINDQVARTRQLAADPVLREGVAYLVDQAGGLWRLQGSTTELIRRLPGTPAQLLSLRGGLVVTLSTEFSYLHEIWRIDLQGGEDHRIPERREVWHLSAPPDMEPSSRTSILAEWNGLLFFPGSVPGIGDELWMTDGTSKGTRLVEDLVPGPNSSYPTHFTVAGDRLFFSAETPELDRELFAVDLLSLDCSPTGIFTPEGSRDCPGKAKALENGRGSRGDRP